MDAPTDLANLRAALLEWYDGHARVLPWRTPPASTEAADPYAVWVSEVMLQQTRVETVLRYYGPFMARFPTAAALADASEDAVMAAWSGLGYYRRARFLHQGVREVVARYGGRVPQDPAARSELPGVGRYTAGAIGSIAFGRAEPIVDGNVVRVLARLFAIDTPPGTRETDTRMWALAGALVEGPRPGDFNQSLMELGATVCSKGMPRCELCPLTGACQARAQGRQGELPRPRAKKPPKPVSLAAVVVHGDDRLCLQRGSGTLFGGLWNLPMAEGRGPRAARAALVASGIAATPATKPVARLEHVLTHRRLSVAVFLAPLSQRAPESAIHGDREHVRVVKLGALPTLGLSSLTKKILGAAGIELP